MNVIIQDKLQSTNLFLHVFIATKREDHITKPSQFLLAMRVDLSVSSRLILDKSRR